MLQGSGCQQVTAHHSLTAAVRHLSQRKHNAATEHSLGEHSLGEHSLEEHSP